MKDWYELTTWEVVETIATLPILLVLATLFGKMEVY